MTNRFTRGAAVVVALAAITALGGTLRFMERESMGPYLIDDGYYLLEGQFFYQTAKSLIESAERKLEERRTGVDLWKRDAEIARIRGEIGKLAEVPKLAYARPLTSLSCAVSMALGGGPKPWTGGVMAAFYGTLTIPLLFLLLWRNYNLRAGLFGALLLAVSGLHIQYSRAGLAETPSTFFLVASLLFYTLSLKIRPDRSLPRAFLAGIFWGVAIVAQDRWILMTALLVVGEGYLWFRTRRDGEFTWGLRAARMAAIAIGVGLPILAMEIPYYGAMIVLRNLGYALPFPTYLEGLLYHLAWGYSGATNTMIGSVPWFAWSNVLVFPYLFAAEIGPVGVLLAIGGLVVALRDRSPRAMVLVLWLLVPLVYYTKSRAVARYETIMIPAMAALGGVFLADLGWMRERSAALKNWRPHGSGATAVVTALILTGLIPSFVVIRWAHGGYPAAIARIPIDDHQLLSTEALGSGYLVGLDHLQLEPPLSVDELRAMYARGVRYFLVDLWRYYHDEVIVRSTGYEMPADHPLRKMLAVIKAIEAKTEPIIVEPNPFVSHMGSVLEANFDFMASWYFYKHHPQGAGEIRVYDLKDFMATLPPPAPVDVPEMLEKLDAAPGGDARE
ncbi:MAG: glycosyltransferase family 39 protein [Myxococcales bacterium]|nr:glycosyltransferase family 39 protein [Myxococcales bacterium]